MCGVVGYLGNKSAKDVVIKGLKRLEYRGYDSAGVSFLSNGKVKTIKVCGKVSKLKEAVAAQKDDGIIGIAHTRWATHGIPSRINAHPHSSGDVAVVHNGIIENYDVLRKQITDHSKNFESISRKYLLLISILAV